MLEVNGNLWTYEADWRVVTTNGVVKKTSGVLVMGKGVALEAMMKYPGLAQRLGTHVRKNGNVPCFLPEINLISLPTKHHWENPSDLKLIVEGCQTLAGSPMIGRHETVVMPMPGCGNGGLNWTDVKKIIEPLLDDRFIVLVR